MPPVWQTGVRPRGVRCPSPCSRACSTASTRRACNGNWKAHFVKNLSEEAIVCISSTIQAAHPHTPHASVPHQRRRRPRRQHRHGLSLPRRRNGPQVIVGVDPDPAKKEIITSWARNTGKLCGSLGIRRIRQLLMDEGQERARAVTGLITPPGRHPRRNTTRPTSIRVNQNIRPAA